MGWINIKATLADGTTFIGPIQGNGGRIGGWYSADTSRSDAERTASARMARVQSLVLRGRDHGVYDPTNKPYDPNHKGTHVAIYVGERFNHTGKETPIPVAGTTFQIARD